MGKSTPPSSVWVPWLSAASVGVALFGLVLVLAPELTSQGFSLLVYFRHDQIAGFGAEALKYIQLAHAVLGAVMVGWGVLLLLLVRRFFARGFHEAWSFVAASLSAWFVPDTAFSLWSGFWPNAMLNVIFAVLFAVPLAATYRAFHKAGANSSI
jgi:hypothetical protein